MVEKWGKRERERERLNLIDGPFGDVNEGL